MKMLRSLLLSVFIVSLCFPGAGFGKESDPRKALGSKKIPEFKATREEGPVEIQADRLTYDKDEQLYQGHGNVEIVRGDFSLKADHARFSSVTSDMVAWGHVVMREGEDVLECERLEVNLNTRVGKVYGGKLFLKDQNFHIEGKEAEKLGESSYRVREGSFTTCDASRPPWSFSVRELDVDTEGRGIARGPVFYIEGIPVFYFPVIPFPVKRERQTGLLLPTGGYSSLYGPKVKTGFYWAMSKDMDSTLYVDYLGDRGFKEGLEYRYAFPHETTGEAKFYFIDDHVYGDKRYAFFSQHQQKLPYDFYLKGDINYVSDRFYPRDFDADLPEKTRIDSRSLNELRSVLFGGKNWDQFSLLVEGEMFNNLTQSNNDQTVQKYPQVSFVAQPQSLFKTPLFYDFSFTYTHFYQEEGLRTHRTDVFPQISYPMRLFNVLKITPDVGFRETYYRNYNDPKEQVNHSRSREMLDTGVDVSAELYRVYEADSASWISNLLRVAKWMHTIEPDLGYRYNPRVSQSDLPSYDSVDRIPYRSEITYGFTQRLLGKVAKEKASSVPFEYVRLKVFQNYSLGDPYTVDERGRGKYFSNIQGELWMNFNPYLSFRGNAELDPYKWDFNVLNGVVKAKDFRDDTVQVEYRFTQGKIQQLNFYTKVRTIDPLFLYGGILYNLLEKTRVESAYGAVFEAQCWSLGLLVEDVNRSPDGTQKRELKVEVYVTLRGVGSLGRIPRIMSL